MVENIAFPLLLNENIEKKWNRNSELPDISSSVSPQTTECHYEKGDFKLIKYCGPRRQNQENTLKFELFNIGEDFGVKPTNHNRKIS